MSKRRSTYTDLYEAGLLLFFRPSAFGSPFPLCFLHSNTIAGRTRTGVRMYTYLLEMRNAESHMGRILYIYQCLPPKNFENAIPTCISSSILEEVVASTLAEITMANSHFSTCSIIHACIILNYLKQYFFWLPSLSSTVHRPTEM